MMNLNRKQTIHARMHCQRTTATAHFQPSSRLIFSLLYTPCVAAIASVKRELGWKWSAGLVVWQCVLAWIVSFLFRIIVLACTGGFV